MPVIAFPTESGAHAARPDRQARFAGRQNPHVPVLDRSLMQLLQAVPKTEEHCHLSGSANKPLIQDFMRENGLSEPEIRRLSRLKNTYRDLDDFLATYYKVPAQVRTPDQFRRATFAIIQEAARENVRYMEIRSSILAKGGATPHQIVNAIETGMREGMAWAKQTNGFDMNVGLIVLAQRAGTPEQSLESAKLAVDFARQPGSLIRGFDLAGSEGQHTVLKHAEALRYVKAHGLPLTVHAGETANSEGMTGADSIRAALALGADRIGHGLQAITDPQLLSELVQKRVPIEVCPWSNVQINAVPDYPTHPLSTLLDQNANVNLNTDNRMMSKITLTQQLAQLYANNLLPCWEQLKTMTFNGIQGAFVPLADKARMTAQFRAQFVQVETTYRNVINRFFCKTCTHPKTQTLRTTA